MVSCLPVKKLSRNQGAFGSGLELGRGRRFVYFPRSQTVLGNVTCRRSCASSQADATKLRGHLRSQSLGTRKKAVPRERNGFFRRRRSWTAARVIGLGLLRLGCRRRFEALSGAFFHRGLAAELGAALVVLADALDPDFVADLGDVVHAVDARRRSTRRCGRGRPCRGALRRTRRSP